MFASKVRSGCWEVKRELLYLIMLQRIKSNNTTSTPFLNPVLEVLIKGLSVGRSVSRLAVTSDRRSPADTCVLILAGSGGQTIARGDSLRVRWGYAGSDLTEIFRGFVREIGVAGQVVVRGIDYGAILNSRRVTVTFEDETATGIVKALMAGTGLGLKLEGCDVVIERLPLFDRRIREGLEAVKDFLLRETGEEFGDYIREGTFHWERKDQQQTPIHEFQTGVDLISFEPTPDGLKLLETMVIPVRHSEVVTIEGDRFFVLKADYLWDSGGRTRLWCEPCSNR